MNYNTIAARFPEKLSPSLDFPTPLAAERIFSPATQRDRSRDPRSVPVSSGRLDPQRMSNTLPVQSPLRPCIRQKSLAWYGRLELCSSIGKFLRAQASHIPERTAQGSRKIQAKALRRAALYFPRNLNKLTRSFRLRIEPGSSEQRRDSSEQGLVHRGL